MPTRRSMLLAAAATAACATQTPRDAADELLDHAIARMGGVDAINRSRVLAWTGHARIHADNRNIDIGLETVVEPFAYARSDTWLASEGRSAMRSLEIDGDRGTIIRNGESSPMPTAMLRNEKAQFAIYGLMRLVSLRDPGVILRTLPLPPTIPTTWRYGLNVDHPAAMDVNMFFDSSAALVGMDNTVPSVENNGAPIRQVFTLGELRESSTGMYWPSTLSITQDRRPFFDLTFETFTPRQSR
jgi:hypothetical protein